MYLDVLETRSCMRCPICPIKYRCVAGDGPRPARVMCVGEAPGRTEDAGGRPFVGDAGREFNENYLHLAGLDRYEVYVTNTVKCRPDLNRKPSEKEAFGCAGHFLPGELAEVKPDVVILMGATACSLLVEKVDLEAEHGIPRLGELYGHTCWIVPMYHPAGGLHDTAMMIPLLEDWEKLGKWLERDEWVWPVDSSAKDYGLLDSKQEVEEYAHKFFITTLKKHSVVRNTPFLIGGDTESQEGVPYSWQVSLEPHVARMVMLKNKAACEALAGFLYGGTAMNSVQYVFHYAPADLPIFERELELNLDGKYTDTMLEGYGFGGRYGRLGLKTLARRVLGRQRLSWEETVTPWSKEVLGQWMMQGMTHAETYWQDTIERFHKKSGKSLKPTVVRALPEKLLVELWQYSLNNSDYPVWAKLIERMPVAWMEKLVEACGPVPIKGIAHCPIDVQIEYACSDPDDTRQLAVMFKDMRRKFVEELNVQDEDVDV